MPGGVRCAVEVAADTAIGQAGTGGRGHSNSARRVEGRGSGRTWENDLGQSSASICSDPDRRGHGRHDFAPGLSSQGHLAGNVSGGCLFGDRNGRSLRGRACPGYSQRRQPSHRHAMHGNQGSAPGGFRREIQYHSPSLRIPHFHRAGQRHAAVPPRKMGGQRGSQDLDLASQNGREVAQGPATDGR
jgi:hypothetical protein